MESAVYHSEEDRQPTEALRNSWATAAIHRAQFWKVIIGAWKDRKEVLHNEKNSGINQKFFSQNE